MKDHEGRRGDHGQTSVMIVGFFVVVALLVAVVVDASAAYLGQRRAADLVDGAALAASEGVTREHLYSTSTTVPLDVAAARRSVADYLEEVDAARDFERLEWLVTERDGTVRVQLIGRVRLPLVPPGWDQSARVRADAVVELRVR